jgi:protocatechuate 3,4-dioxygenase beta subunit
VQAANRPVLTTQLYFPDDSGNARDGIFRKELLMRFVGDRTPPVARFDFVLDIA